MKLKFSIALQLLCLCYPLPAFGHSSTREAFQYDYCSYTHSQHVLDRIESEVKPIFEKYGMAMVTDSDQCMLSNFAPIKKHLEDFSHKTKYQATHECKICGKKFDSEDHLELHLKQNHFRSEKLQTQYETRGMTCPAELCDVFECPEFSQKTLRLQVYMERTDFNYEGAPDYRLGLGGVKKKDPKELPPFRWEMMKHYDQGRQPHLLQRCHRLFLDCIDHEKSKSMDQTIKGLDIFSQVYCQKFNGQVDSKEAEREEQDKGLGIYKMLHDMHDSVYLSPLGALEEITPAFKKPKNDGELRRVLWWVALTVSGILLFLFFIAVYFTYFDDPKEFKRTVNNRGWMTNSAVNMERQRVREARRREGEEDRFAAPTQTTVYRDAQTRRRRVSGKDD